MNICEHLSVSARLFPDKVAIVFEGQRLTYAELDELSQSAAQRLLESNVQRGDRVAIMLPNVPAFVVWYYAALRIGTIAVSVSTRLTPAEVGFVISDCEAVALVSLPQTLSATEHELPSSLAARFDTSESGAECQGKRFPQSNATSSNWIETDPDEAAVILYTSGTTGFAKGATLSHMNVRSNVHAFNHLCNTRFDDRILLAVPLFHCFGQNALLNSAFNAGATVVLQRSFDLVESKHLIASERVTQLYGVPMMFRLFEESCQPQDLSSVTYCFSAAAPLPVQTSQRWHDKFGMPIYEGYGLTETSPFSSYNHRTKYVLGSVGTPIDCVEMKIVDTETGNVCPPNIPGEIAIRGPNVMIGYWNRPADTAAAIRDGWFYSGDIGQVDAEGFFYVVDRVKDMISVGGLKVYPAEVERVLRDHKLVSQVAVVGNTDEMFGERVIAFIIPANRTNPDAESEIEILRHAKSRLANYKVPQSIFLVDELPRNPAGKILKTKLRENLRSSTRARISEAGNETLGSAPNPAELGPRLPQPSLRTKLEKTYPTAQHDVVNSFVASLVQTLTESGDVPNPQTRLLDAGLDSLMVVELSSHLQVEVGPDHELPATLVFDHPRICDLSEFLVNLLAPGELTNDSSDLDQSSSGPPAAVPLQEEIAKLTEKQAFEELMKELEA